MVITVHLFLQKFPSRFSCKVQLFWEGHKNVRNHPYGFEIYLVSVKTITGWFLWPSKKNWTLAKEKKSTLTVYQAFQFIREFTILKLPNQNSTAYCFLSPITSHQATNMLLIKTDGSWSSVSSFRILSEFQS